MEENIYPSIEISKTDKVDREIARGIMAYVIWSVIDSDKTYKPREIRKIIKEKIGVSYSKQCIHIWIDNYDIETKRESEGWRELLISGEEVRRMLSTHFENSTSLEFLATKMEGIKE